MKFKASNIIDSYLDKPLRYDLIIVISLILIEAFIIVPVVKSIGRFGLIVLDHTEQLAYIANLISASVSLAGFILAALTIMISVKSSLKARGFNDAENALEFLFTTKHYFRVVKVFKHATIELVIVAFVLFLASSLIANFSVLTIQRLIFATTFATVLAVVRALFILFKVLSLEEMKR